MKSNSKNLTKRNGNWYVTAMINGKRIFKSTGCKTIRKAVEFRDEYLRPFQAKDEIDQLASLQQKIDRKQSELDENSTTPPLPISEAWQMYEDTLDETSSRTINGYHSQWNRFSTWISDKHPTILELRNITPEHAEEFSRHIKKHYSANTHNKYIVLLRSIFDTVAREAQLTTNPWATKDIKKIKLKGKTQSRREFTIDELKRIIDTSTGDLQTLFIIGAFTGLRLGDAATLRWSEVDLDCRLIRRVPRKTKHTSGAKVKIGISAYLLNRLQQTPKNKRRGYVLPKMATLYERDNSALTKMIQQHLHACDIETTTKINGRTVTLAGFHSLRHTYVSLHAEAGTPQSIIQQNVGHGSPSMTEHYEHLSDQAARQHTLTLQEFNNTHTDAKNEVLATIKDQLSGMNTKNWATIRDELLSMLN